MKVIDNIIYTEVEYKLQTQLITDVMNEMAQSFINSPVEQSTIQYSWKDSEWKDLRSYPTLYAEYEMIKLKRMYSYEYDFKLKTT